MCGDKCSGGKESKRDRREVFEEVAILAKGPPEKLKFMERPRGSETGHHLGICGRSVQTRNNGCAHREARMCPVRSRATEGHVCGSECVRRNICPRVL